MRGGPLLAALAAALAGARAADAPPLKPAAEELRELERRSREVSARLAGMEEARERLETLRRGYADGRVPELRPGREEVVGEARQALERMAAAQGDYNDLRRRLDVLHLSEGMGRLSSGRSHARSWKQLGRSLDQEEVNDEVDARKSAMFQELEAEARAFSDALDQARWQRRSVWLLGAAAAVLAAAAWAWRKTRRGSRLGT